MSLEPCDLSHGGREFEDQHRETWGGSFSGPEAFGRGPRKGEEAGNALQKPLYAQMKHSQIRAPGISDGRNGVYLPATIRTLGEVA